MRRTLLRNWPVDVIPNVDGVIPNEAEHMRCSAPSLGQTGDAVGRPRDSSSLLRNSFAHSAVPGADRRRGRRLERFCPHAPRAQWWLSRNDIARRSELLPQKVRRHFQQQGRLRLDHQQKNVFHRHVLRLQP